MISPLAQRERLERKFNIPDPPWPWQRRGCSLTFTFCPFISSISLSSPTVNWFLITLEPVVTVIVNFFPSCTISETLLRSLPFWIWSSGSPAQEQETLSEQWSHLWVDCCRWTNQCSRTGGPTVGKISIPVWKNLSMMMLPQEPYVPESAGEKD